MRLQNVPPTPDTIPFNIGIATPARQVGRMASEVAEPEPCGTCDDTKVVDVSQGHGDTDRIPCPECDPHDVTGRPLTAAPERVRIPADENGPSRLVLAGSPVGKTFDGPSMLVGANGKPISATPEVTSDLIDVRGESLNSLTWPTYLAWRKTKCRPYDYETGPASAVSLFKPEDGSEFDRMSHRRALEEIDQATLEMIGEVAELGELFKENGPTVFWGSLRDKLIDECGDILFCSAWALDAWGSNPLSEADDLELIRVTDDNEMAVFAGVIAGNQMGVVLGNPRFVSMLGGMIYSLMLTAQTNAGLTANAFKKLKFQRRAQDVDKQVGRIANVLAVVNQILIVANSSVEEALKVNMRKLDARYPNGYQPGQGGGNRTGEGK